MLTHPTSKREQTIESVEKCVTGRLFYFMGPSGVGKDTILNTLRELQDNKILFATRYITRPVIDDGEMHREISEEKFLKRQQEGFFAFTWRSHGFFYGIPARLLSTIASGNDVIVNGSRSYFYEAAKMFPDIIPVLVTASEVTVLQRLKTRGREPEQEIQKRLQRLQTFSIDHPNLITLENESTPKVAATSFLSQINKKPVTLEGAW